MQVAVLGSASAAAEVSREKEARQRIALPRRSLDLSSPRGGCARIDTRMMTFIASVVCRRYSDLYFGSEASRLESLIAVGHSRYHCGWDRRPVFDHKVAEPCSGYRPPSRPAPYAASLGQRTAFDRERLYIFNTRSVKCVSIHLHSKAAPDEGQLGTAAVHLE